jgi:deazaflavin-dependent oxidoreductase (nitroreductase family)
VSDWNKKIIDEFRANGGKDVGQFGNRLLLLTTRGAKTGRPHTTPLAYTRDGDSYVVIASMGGAPKHPAWYHNVVASPDAEIEVGGDVGTETLRVRATPVPAGPERDRLFEAQAQIMPGFRDYEVRTKGVRTIPVVVLERVDEARQAA